MALRAQIDINTIIMGDLNTPQSLIVRSSRQNINKETPVLLHTSDQIDMVGIYRIFHPINMQYASFQQFMELSPK
jgi:hypothetical protein